MQKKGSVLRKEAGLAAIENQNLSIKLEIDTKPPLGALIEKTLVARHRIISLQHYELPSLMAGKDPCVDQQKIR